MSTTGVYIFLGLAVFCAVVLVITFIIDYRKWWKTHSILPPFFQSKLVPLFQFKLTPFCQFKLTL